MWLFVFIIMCVFLCSVYFKDYKNEDVVVGVWMLGLDIEYVDD